MVACVCTVPATAIHSYHTGPLLTTERHFTLPERVPSSIRTDAEPIRSESRQRSWRSGMAPGEPFNTPAPEVAKQIADIAQLLEDVDARSSRRLEELSNAIPDEDGRHRWSDVDLRRAFNTDRLSHAYAVKYEGGYAPRTIEIADKLRNVLVLLPILLTWFALGEAVSNYSSYIDKHPDDAGTPFLVLWERGFGKEASLFAPSLSHVAFIDAVLIGIIILLTFYAHGRREEQEDAIADTASLFQAEMDNALAEASVLLATDRTSRPVRLADAVERMADSFEESSQALLTQLQVEHDRMEMMAARREREVTDFGSFAVSMRQGSEELHRLLMTLRDVSTNLERSLQDLGSDIAISAQQQGTLLTAVSNLERMTSSAIQNDQAATRQLAQTAARLEETAEKSITGAESASQAGRIALDAVREISGVAKEIGASHERVDKVLSAHTSASNALAETLRNTDSHSSITARHLADIGNGLAELRGEFGTIADQQANYLQTLNTLFESHAQSSSDLTQLARDIGGVAIETAQRQRELTDGLQHLLQRLDSMANTLNHLIAQQPGRLRSRIDEPDPRRGRS